MGFHCFLNVIRCLLYAVMLTPESEWKNQFCWVLVFDTASLLHLSISPHVDITLWLIPCLVVVSESFLFGMHSSVHIQRNACPLCVCGMCSKRGFCCECLDPATFERDGTLLGSGMSNTTTASPKASFRASWIVGDAVFIRGSAGWTTWKSGHPFPCQAC